MSSLSSLTDKEVFYVREDSHFSDPNIDDNNRFIDEDSPYPEVQCAVPNTDDPHIPVNTIRAWVLGIIFAIIIPAANQLLIFRLPSVAFSEIVAQLLLYPIGCFWARCIPNYKIFGASLNPGPFTIKEHVLSTIMASVGINSAYATEIIAVQRVYYNQDFGFGYQWMLLMSTQLIGFSIGGIVRRILVNPPSMIWPINLVGCVLFNTLHSRSYGGNRFMGGISREKFFLHVFGWSASWYFIPGYLFQGLSYFSWICWIVPDNVAVNQMFGYVHGLGMSVITFDWAQIAYVGSPLATPWWAEANIIAGFLFFFWFLTPILHFTNVWYGKYLPMSDRSAYDNTGNVYNLTRILNDDATFSKEMYQEYSPLFLPTTFAISYGISFASITSAMVHAILHYSKQIWHQARKSMTEQADVHARLMTRYRQVPEWWYGIIFVTMFVFGIAVIEAWPTKLPIPWFILALAISFVYVLPVGILQAVTNQQVSLNVFSELIIGYGLPGRPVAMMLFKTWSYITLGQALTFTKYLKLGHYMKIPPRPMFFAQVLATIIAGTAQLGVQSWLFNTIPDICQPDQKDGFVCPATQVFATASVIWGLIGPSRLFSNMYSGLSWFFLIGAICPVISYLLSRKYPYSWFRYINFPVLFSGVSYMPPASAVNYVTFAIVGFIFQYVIRRRHTSWWTKYNYVLSAALDAGVSVSAVLIFFTLQFPKNGTIGLNTVQSWWGNTVFSNTADAKGTPLLTVPDGSTFGPQTWF